jgi:hypothetical protein
MYLYNSKTQVWTTKNTIVTQKLVNIAIKFFNQDYLIKSSFEKITNARILPTNVGGNFPIVRYRNSIESILNLGP